jgi:hypothetical protein
MAAVLTMWVDSYRLFNAGDKWSQGRKTAVMVEAMKRLDRRQ